MKNYYHVSSKALEKNVMFRTREDFVAAMNDVAMCSLRFDVQILCFCLMGNHFHFILSGGYHECRKFGEEFKRMCAMVMRQTQDIEKAMKNVEIQIKRIAHIFLPYKDFVPTNLVN